ncbi:TonB-dependent receptor [Larkinella terrae]|uniref:SusC/RagA family TonB-linked outer membrane protein n=2 Tax=Larkinella terrae TaxID=2025311 RepID=A0A7K0EML7_9BACT|nr:SusC/RagA family TonB-linked outer membrane protein [Larkinella terrae]
MYMLRRTAFALALLGFSLPSPGQSFARLTPDQETKPAANKAESPQALEQVLQTIQARQKVFFNYSNRLIQNKTVVVNLDEITSDNLDKQLNDLLQPLGLQFEKQAGRRYLIFQVTPKNTKPADPTTSRVETAPISIPKLLAIEPAAIEVTGRVTAGDNKEPLPGVSVILKGTTKGTTTDAEGKFRLEAADETSVLIFSFVGYLPEEIVVGTRKVIDVVLKADTKALEEIVVVGYGTQKRADITGAITSISEKSLREVPVTNAQQMLQGRAAGVYVVQSSYKPGSGATVQIRGRRSFSAGNDPLYVVDGIPISGGFNDINPSDIVSMEVLKDASATAIYGSRGANGVVIISTKRGTPGRISVNYTNYLGVSTISRYANMMNGAEFAAYRREAARTAGRYDIEKPAESDKLLFEPVELASIAEGRSTDYQRMVVRNGFTNNHDVSVSGGTDKTRFNISLGYFRDKGIIPGQDFTRFTSRINIDQKIGQRFSVGTSMLGSYSVQNGADLNVYQLALQANPLGVPYGPTGNLIFRPTNDALITNPMSDLVKGASINVNKRFRLFTSLYGEAEIIDGLKFRMNFGPDLTKSNLGNFRGKFTNASQGGVPSANVTEEFVFNYTWENILTYKKTLARLHTLDLTGLYSIQARTQENLSANVQGLPVESLQFFNLGQGSTINSVGSAYSKWAILSYMGRINYAFDDRFLLTFTGRFDGSSRFAPGNQWGFFPSVALGWNLINEDFLKTSKVFSNLKLRMSYGETGNTGIDPYQTQGLLTRTTYDFDGTAAYGYRPGTIRNSSLKWETTGSANVGIDFGLLNERITGSVEFYRSTTRDLLLPRVLPTTSGFTSILENVGSTRNTGFEFTLSTRNIVAQNNGFTWSTDFNFFTNKEKILELSQGKADDVGNARFIGQPISVFYDYERIGIWQLGEDKQAAQFSSKVGQNKINDRNGNGVIDPDDRMILGTSVPKFTGGLTNRFSYKGFDLSIFLFARFGNMIQSGFHDGSIFALAGRFNNFKVDYWTKDNPTNAYPQPNLSQERPLFNSTLTYFDGSFIKVRNINLGYNLASDLAKKLRTNAIRVYGSIQNPLMYAPYVQKHNGIDPEIPTSDTPLSRQFLAGVNITF